MMNPEEIARKAAHKKQNTSNKKVPENKKFRVPNTYKALSFKVHKRIYPGRMNIMLWFLLCVPGTALICLYLFDPEIGIWSLVSGIGFYAVFVIRIILNYIAIFTTYNSYKKFITNPGFTLEGWDTLGSVPNQLSSSYWSYKSSVEVVLRSNIRSEHSKYIKDALFLFITEANGEFYEAEAGGDGRQSWVKNNEFKVEGSSNPAVIGKLYKLLNVYLKSIQNKYNLIDSVIVFFDPNIFEVNPPPYTD